MPEEVEKLKKLATDKNLLVSQHIDAIGLLGDIGTREAMLALLDVAADSGLLASERSYALIKAREIIKSGIS